MNRQNETLLLFANQESINNYPVRNAKKMATKWACVKMDGIGLIGIYGGIGNSMLDWEAQDYTDITAKVEVLRCDPDIKGIVLAIYSPGGTVAGFYDACEYIKNCGKKCYAFIDGEACSAAYGLASACEKIYASSHSLTGCCGCYAAVSDYSEAMLKDWGIVRKVFRSANAPKKNLSPITDKEAEKDFQARIDAEGDAYLEMVASCRGIDKGKAEKTFGQGAVVSAEYALENGMIDCIGSLEQCMADIKKDCETNCECESNSDSSLSEGGKEETDMSIKETFDALSAEEQKAFLNQVISANPSLVAERDKAVLDAEKARVTALDALKNGSEAVDAIVNAAVTDGRCANDIALDVIKAMQQQPKAGEADKMALEVLADNAVQVNVPGAKSEDELIDALVAGINKGE